MKEVTIKLACTTNTYTSNLTKRNLELTNSRKSIIFQHNNSSFNSNEKLFKHLNMDISDPQNNPDLVLSDFTVFPDTKNKLRQLFLIPQEAITIKMYEVWL